MSIAKVKEYLAAYGAAERVREFDVSSATVELAAKALGCEEARIAKTLSFMLGPARIRSALRDTPRAASVPSPCRTASRCGWTSR